VLAHAFAGLKHQTFHVFSDFAARDIADGSGMTHVTLFPIDESSFVQSITRCAAVICTAGNQTIGEALFLEKPVLAIPEPLAFEQQINAMALEQTACGASCSLEELNSTHIARFLEALPTYRTRLSAIRTLYPTLDATDMVANRIEEVLSGGSKYLSQRRARSCTGLGLWSRGLSKRFKVSRHQSTSTAS
jgi:predicted glycosyltransferase